MKFWFRLKVKIKDEGGKVIELWKTENIEVSWNKGAKYSNKSQKEITFEKDGSNYQITLNFVLESASFWTNRVKVFNFEVPLNFPYHIYYGEFDGDEPRREKDEEVINHLELIDRWKKSRVISGFVLTVAFMVIILIFRNKNKKRDMRKSLLILSFSPMLLFLFFLLLEINISRFFGRLLKGYK